VKRPIPLGEIVFLEHLGIPGNSVPADREAFQPNSYHTDYIWLIFRLNFRPHIIPHTLPACRLFRPLIERAMRGIQMAGNALDLAASRKG
jgi:hypothetical protein